MRVRRRTTTGAKNPAVWQFLASIVNGAGTSAILNKGFNDLPSFSNTPIPTGLAPRVVSLYKQQLGLLSQAQNQRFYSPVVQNALDNALAGVAAGSETPAAALAKVQASQSTM